MDAKISRSLLLLLGNVVLGALAATAGCSKSDDPAPVSGPDAAVDAAPPPHSNDGGIHVTLDAGVPTPGTSCMPNDGGAKNGTGPKFCDLPGTDAPIAVPDGFCVREFTTTPITEPRVLRFAPNGDLFVSSPAMTTPGGAYGGPGAIVVLADDDHDGKAEVVIHYAGSPITTNSDCATAEKDSASLACVHGLLFSGGYLYYSRSDEVRRFPYASGDRKATVPSGELVAALGGDGKAEIRWTHTLDQAKNGEIYVSRGRYEASACADTEMAIGSIFSLPIPMAGGGGALPVTPAVVADGFRNPMFIRCQPGCGDCYVNELSGDSWASVGGREKLGLISPNGHWGYPCCVAPNVPAPDVPGQNCAAINGELTSIDLHDTPFGMDFEPGVFPSPYSYGVFIALHGQVGSWTGTGIAWVSTDPVTHKPTNAVRSFATGWGQTGSQVDGRATDVAFSPDGRLFVGDDQSGRIFWIAPRTLSMPAH